MLLDTKPKAEAEPLQATAFGAPFASMHRFFTTKRSCEEFGIMGTFIVALAAALPADRQSM